MGAELAGEEVGPTVINIDTVIHMQASEMLRVNDSTFIHVLRTSPIGGDVPSQFLGQHHNLQIILLELSCLTFLFFVGLFRSFMRVHERVSVAMRL